MRYLARRAVLGAGLLGIVSIVMGANEPEKKSGVRAREFAVQGFHVRIDPARQVIGVEVPEDRGFSRADRDGREEAAVSPTLAATGGFVSASVLAQKAKQFDDGLYATVELAAQNGAGRYPGKTSLLAIIARGIDPAPGGNAETVLLSACRLGGVRAAIPDRAQAAIDSAINEFDADPLRSKPIGFYTWSGSLSAIFRQDRMLRSELKGAAGIAALARLIHADKSARATYEGYLSLVSRLTNPMTEPDLRGPLQTLDAGGSEFPAKGLAFFPASRAHETDLVKKLYMDRPIPDGFNLVEELMRRIRSGQIDLTPTASSGWYDYQTWALEPLVAPERAAEGGRLKLEESYRKQLAELFKGILALTRETHAKQLEIPAPGAKARGADREPVEIHVNPELSAEPLATFYARRAASYRFVRSALEKTFGAEAIRGLHRQTATGPVKADLAAELDSMEAIFSGASAALSRELGLAEAVSAPPEATPGRSADADREAFARWAATMNSDPDIGRDSRMMVPVFFDRGRAKTKVWVFLGWSQRPVNFWFAAPPSALVTKDGKPAKADEVVVEFGNTHRSLAYPVTAEVYVEQIMDRDEFRRHCDRYKTRSEILRNLK